MTDQPLFYKTTVPLNREFHRDLHVPSAPDRFHFAASSHIVPAVIEEFVAASRHLPIVFIPGVGAPSAVFLLGLSPGDNRFVGADGRWTGDYIPAYVRRYPFIIGEVTDGQPLVCIDETYDGLKNDAGEKLLLENGEESPGLKAAVQLMNDYMTAAKHNDEFISELQKLELLQVITIDIRTPGQETRTLHGAMMVDADKLAALKDADFLQLRQRGYLPAIYAHLSSIAGIDRLRPDVDAAAAGNAVSNETADVQPTNSKSRNKRETAHAQN